MLFKKLTVALLTVVMGLGIITSPVTAKSLEKAMVIFTFDDGALSQWLYVRPALWKHKFPATAYVVTDWIGDGEHLTWAQLWSLYGTYGWEVGQHTKSHPHFLFPSPPAKPLTNQQILAELRGARDALAQRGFVNATAFVTPFGEVYENAVSKETYERIMGLIKQVGFLSSSRRAWTEDSPYNLPATFDRWAVNVVALRSDNMTVAEAKQLIDQAIAAKAAIVFAGHTVTPELIADPSTQFSLADFQIIVDYVNAKKSAGLLEVTTITRAVSKLERYKNLP